MFARVWNSHRPIALIRLKQLVCRSEETACASCDEVGFTLKQVLLLNVTMVQCDYVVQLVS